MRNKKFDIIFGFFLVIALVLTRKLPLLPNLSLMGTAFLFSGYLSSKNKGAFIVPYAALFISDYWIGFYSGMSWVYSGFALSLLVGTLIKEIKFTRIAVASLISSLAFYLLSNFGVWTSGTLYTRSLSGLLECYVAAVPFFRNTLLSDLVGSLAVFYVFQFAQKFWAPQSVKNQA
jgi:hypothetical protein